MPENALLERVKNRLFFKSHESRLTDLEKARLMGIDKELIGIRKTNLKKASARYIELQNNALTTPETGPGITSDVP